MSNWELLFEGEVTSATNPYYLRLSRALGTAAGEDYLRVTVDGVTLESETPVGNGSLYLSTKEDTGEDFYFYVSAVGRKILYTKTTGAHTVKIERRIPQGHYSYNDVILPPLPDWDKDVYPYAYIAIKYSTNDYDGDGNVDATANFLLYISPVELCISSDNKLVTRDGSTVTGLYDSVYASGETWKEQKETTYKATSGKYAPFWANTDVYNADGTLYLAASDPVPVEPEEPEQPVPVLTNRDLYRKSNGQLVKHTLYKKVGGELVKVDEYST